MKEETKKLDNIDLVKTIMMVLVVLYHSLRYFTGDWFNIYGDAPISNYAIYITAFLKMFHVPSFCMALGFLYYYLKFEKNKYKILKDNIYNKIKRLLIPCISTIVLWALPIGMIFYKYSVKEIIYKFVLMASPVQLWFLIALFNIFCIAFIFPKKINLKNLIIIYLISTICGSTLDYFGIHFFQIHTTIQYFLFFYLGGYIYKNKNTISTKKIIICFIILIPLLIVRFSSLNCEGVVYYLIRMIEPLISVLEIIVVYFLCTAFTKKYSLNNKLYLMISNNSFGIYLFHQQIIYIMIYAFNKHVNSFGLISICFFASLLISLLMSLFFKKFKFTKTIFGL